MNKVSVIVPVYNSERYMAECIESILNQTYSDLELILIDDGSADRSGTICDGYQKDSRVRILHRGNQGVSRTRNEGISLARGEYLLFVDSDDTIESDMVESMVSVAEKTDADVVFCGLWHDYMDGSKRKFPDKEIYWETDGITAIREVFKNYIATAGPVCKLFRKELVKTDMFPVDLTVGEDAVAVVQVLKKAGVVVFDTKPFYHYNHREDSLMTSEFSTRDLDLIRAYERIGSGILPDQCQKECEFRRIWAHFHVYDKILLSTDKTDEVRVQEREIRHWLRSRAGSILRNPYVGKKRKIALITLLCHKSIYQKIICQKNS